MRSSSCKAKGRRLQTFIVEELYEAFPSLREGDLKSTSSGANGEDVQLSPAARALIPYSFEAKNQERMNIWAALEQSSSNSGQRTPVVVIKKNHTAPHAVIPWKLFLSLISAPPPPMASSAATAPCQLDAASARLRTMAKALLDVADDIDPPAGHSPL